GSRPMSGHVFLVHGNLTRLACDAWLVPSGTKPKPGDLWEKEVAPAAPPNTPGHWHEISSRVIPWDPLRPGWPQPWVVRTVGSPARPADEFVEPAAEFLQRLSGLAEQKARNGRALPLVALPVVGAGHGGGSHMAGEIVRALLPELYRFTQAYAIDVALVMKE